MVMVVVARVGLVRGRDGRDSADASDVQNTADASRLERVGLDVGDIGDGTARDRAVVQRGRFAVVDDTGLIAGDLAGSGAGAGLARGGGQGNAGRAVAGTDGGRARQVGAGRFVAGAGTGHVRTDGQIRVDRRGSVATDRGFVAADVASDTDAGGSDLAGTLGGSDGRCEAESGEQGRQESLLHVILLD